MKIYQLTFNYCYTHPGTTYKIEANSVQEAKEKANDILGKYNLVTEEELIELGEKIEL